MSTRTDISLIAARYASALFSLAAKDSALDAVDADLAQLADAIRADQSVAKLLAHPLISREAKAEAMAALLKTKKAHPLTQQGVAQIAEGGRLAALPAVADAFRRLLDAERGIENVTVIAARSLSKKDEADLAKALKAALGKEVQLTLAEDASLLGGLKIRLGSRELDMSLSGKLAQMKRALLAA